MCVVSFLICILPAAGRTLYKLSGNDTLVAMILTNPEEYSLNPFSRDGVLVSQNVASWFFKITYSPELDCQPTEKYYCTPLLNMLSEGGRSIGNEKSKERGAKLIKFMVDRGANVDSRNVGLTALHEAILACDVESMKLLLSLGADPHEKIERPLSKWNAMNAFEFFKYLNEYDRQYDCENGYGVLEEKET